MPTSVASPTPMSPMPIPRPVSDAQRVALRKLPVIPQSAARSTRPPSSGNPGAMLTIASERFITKSHCHMTFVRLSRSPGVNTSTRNTPASATLVSGPTIAMKNSTSGRFASRLICDTPPSMNSVMPRTGMP